MFKFKTQLCILLNFGPSPTPEELEADKFAYIWLLKILHYIIQNRDELLTRITALRVMKLSICLEAYNPAVGKQPIQPLKQRICIWDHDYTKETMLFI